MLLNLYLTKLIGAIILILLISIVSGRKPKRNEIVPAIALSLFFTICVPLFTMVLVREGNGGNWLLALFPLFLLITLRFPNSNIGKCFGVILVILFFVLRVEHLNIVMEKEYTDSPYIIQRYKANAARSEAKKAGKSKEIQDEIAKKASAEAEKHIHPLWHTWLTGLYQVEQD
jgi:hypothetical protein